MRLICVSNCHYYYFFLKIIPFSIQNNGITDILISLCLNSLFHCAFQTSLLASALILLYWQESKESHPSSQQLKKVYRYQIYCYREYNFHTLVFSEVVFKDTVLPFNFPIWDKEFSMNPKSVNWRYLWIQNFSHYIKVFPGKIFKKM